MRYGKRDKESFSTGGLLPHKDPLRFIDRTYVFTRPRQTSRELGANDLGNAYGQPEQVMLRMKSYATSPTELPFLTSIPGKNPWEFLRASGAIHQVHPSEKAVPAERVIRSFGTSLETFKGESLTIKEEEDEKADDAGVHSYLWDRWVMGV